MTRGMVKPTDVFRLFLGGGSFSGGRVTDI